ncbi:MAG TPA: DUF6504 family protein [Thermoleophilia bacterium]|nr:DUF6504 family protein [Thermoleophilia bacterium]
MSRGGATSSDEPGPNGQAREGRPGPSGRARESRPGPNGQAVPVAVVWDERQRRPVTFVWRRRRYQIERVLDTWVVETGWWKDDGHISRSYWRVRAGGRVVDLRYDRIGKAWALEKVLS